MSLKLTLLAGAAAILAGTAAFGASTAVQSSSDSYTADALMIENFIGRVEIREGSGNRISVAMTNSGEHAEDPSISEAGGTVSIDGGQEMRRLSCNVRNDRMRIGYGRSRHPIEEYPSLIITAPASVALELRRSAFVGEAGDLGSLDISMSSCGNFTAGDIAGNADVRISGSGDVTARSVGGSADVDINGSGDVILTAIGGDTSIDISGSGDVAMDDVDGGVDISINGSGDVELGSIGDLSINVSGSGDVEADRMNGAFSARINGSGDIHVRGGRAEPMEARIHGSGDIRFDGTAVNVTVVEGGSGDVHIDDVEGSVNWRRNGRTVLRIGNAE
ncbi:DUF2807 domain-containing protein [Maricaulis sp.]|uniref:GIN domain-containing protein n=1 Tax=Maricaulis sp. TaxID=1486257 RepID=UPI00261F1CFD|nr:DUF2807 domain-containing protein [Maricaulis sp.]